MPLVLLNPFNYSNRLTVQRVAMRFAVVELIGDLLPFAAVYVSQAHDILMPPRELSQIAVHFHDQLHSRDQLRRVAPLEFRDFVELSFHVIVVRRALGREPQHAGSALRGAVQRHQLHINRPRPPNRAIDVL